MAFKALGRVVETDSALKIMRNEGISPATLLHRHASGDRGNLVFKSDEEYEPRWPTTESVYLLPSGNVVNIITHDCPGQSITTVYGIPRHWVKDFIDG